MSTFHIRIGLRNIRCLRESYIRLIFLSPQTRLGAVPRAYQWCAYKAFLGPRIKRTCQDLGGGLFSAPLGYLDKVLNIVGNPMVFDCGPAAHLLAEQSGGGSDLFFGGKMRFENGWIKLHRRVAFGDIGTNVVCLGIWVKLLCMATRQDTRIRRGKVQIDLPQGSIVFGLRGLATEIGINEKTLKKHLWYLEKTERIRKESCGYGTTIEIINWKQYQEVDSEDQPSTGSLDGARDGARGGARGGPVLENEELRIKNKEGDKSAHGSAEALPHLAALWNQHSQNLPKVKGCSATRKRHAENRWRENSNTEYWVELISRVSKSRFCLGDNDRGWRADFDFFVRPGTQHKILEGKYDDKKSPALIQRERNLAVEAQVQKEREEIRRKMREEEEQHEQHEAL